MKKALRIVGALLLLAVIGGCIYLDTLMPIITSRELVVVILGYSPKPDRVIDFNRLLKDVMEVL